MEKAYVSMSDEGRVGLTVGADGPGVVGDLRGSGTLCALNRLDRDDHA